MRPRGAMWDSLINTLSRSVVWASATIAARISVLKRTPRWQRNYRRERKIKHKVLSISILSIQIRALQNVEANFTSLLKESANTSVQKGKVSI